MTFLMVKTHDLSWQDRTVNIEMMLAPARNQLLFNKHKTLETKCNAKKRVYEKEKSTVLKDFVIEKRMMQRKQQALFRRRSEILFQKVASGSGSDSESYGKSRDDSSGKRRLASAPPQLESELNDSKNSKPGFFLTEIRHSAPMETAVPTPHRSRMITPDGQSGMDTPNVWAFTPVSRSDSVSPFSSKRVKSVRFENSDIRNHTLNEMNTESKPPLRERVQSFCKDQCEFNAKPPVTFRKRESIYKDTYKDPLIAKRYSAVKSPHVLLETAFNDMCINGSTKDDFKTLVKLASKIKANAKLARNQSVVPTMAALKCSKSFKKVNERSQSCSPRENEVYV